jgi:hypothetical protein
MLALSVAGSAMVDISYVFVIFFRSADLYR